MEDIAGGFKIKGGGLIFRTCCLPVRVQVEMGMARGQGTHPRDGSDHCSLLHGHRE